MLWKDAEKIICIIMKWMHNVNLYTLIPLVSEKQWHNCLRANLLSEMSISTLNSFLKTLWRLAQWIARSEGSTQIRRKLQRYLWLQSLVFSFIVIRSKSIWEEVAVLLITIYIFIYIFSIIVTCLPLTNNIKLIN